MTDPYAEYKTDDVPSDKLDQLSALADGWEDATEDVEKCATALAEAEAKVREIEEKLIPEIMDDINLEEFKTKSGREIKIKETIRCSTKADDKPKAFVWLVENGYGAIVKRTISIAFGKGENHLADAFKAQSLVINAELEFNDKDDVHWATLDKWLNEKIDAGEYEDLPKDMFPVFRQRVAKIK